MDKYVYKPKRFFIIVFASTWGYWLFAILLNNSKLLFPLLFLGLIAPALTAINRIYIKE